MFFHFCPSLFLLSEESKKDGNRERNKGIEEKNDRKKERKKE
jgi:hypothetical protein